VTDAAKVEHDEQLLHEMTFTEIGRDSQGAYERAAMQYAEHIAKPLLARIAELEAETTRGYQIGVLTAIERLAERGADMWIDREGTPYATLDPEGDFGETPFMKNESGSIPIAEALGLIAKKESSND